jgi:sirohydrochlorin cobaltochelatase
MASDVAGKSAVVLIGHGRRASDTPVEVVRELRSCKQKRSHGKPSARELELESRIRYWPRTPESDPYKGGVERIAGALRHELPGTRVVVAFNEFCAPSIEEAVASLVADLTGAITLISTMFTPGGGHAERDIPETVAELQAIYPNVTLRYAWPFPLKIIASFLAQSILATSE